MAKCRRPLWRIGLGLAARPSQAAMLLRHCPDCSEIYFIMIVHDKSYAAAQTFAVPAIHRLALDVQCATSSAWAAQRHDSSHTTALWQTVKQCCAAQQG